jgi:hypothetical protein
MYSWADPDKILPQIRDGYRLQDFNRYDKKHHDADAKRQRDRKTID